MIVIVRAYQVLNPIKMVAINAMINCSQYEVCCMLRQKYGFVNAPNSRSVGWAAQYVTRNAQATDKRE